MAVAWQEALYGPDGFYRRTGGPAEHFATSAQGVPGVGELFAEALLALAGQLGASHLVDVGAGRGALLARLRSSAPQLRLTGLDVVPRPTGLPTGIDWVVSPGGPDLPSFDAGPDTLIVANEWLDVVPSQIAGWDGDHWRVVLEDRSLGPPLSVTEQEWQQRWWPVEDPQRGDLIEIGLARDEAFARLRAAAGTVVAIDYGHLRRDRPTGGTLMGYRDGAAVPPRFDGTTDVTAHVTMDSLGADEVFTQREALFRLGIRADAPSHDLARADPAGYLRALARRTAWTAARDADGLGGFWWALSSRPDGRGTPPR